MPGDAQQSEGAQELATLHFDQCSLFLFFLLWGNSTCPAREPLSYDSLFSFSVSMHETYSDSLLCRSSPAKFYLATATMKLRFPPCQHDNALALSSARFHLLSIVSPATIQLPPPGQDSHFLFFISFSFLCHGFIASFYDTPFVFTYAVIRGERSQNNVFTKRPSFGKNYGI